MDMNRAGGFFLLLLCGLLFGCFGEEQDLLAGPDGYESESVLQLHPSPVSSTGIDWSEEAELLQGDVIFERLSSALAMEREQLAKMIRFEFDILEERVRIIVRGEEPEEAGAVCRTYADLYREYRKEREVRRAREVLDRLDRELAESEAKVEKSRAELAKLLSENGLVLPGTEEGSPTLEEDRLTYRKALEALREDAGEGGTVPDDGVLFRKEENP